MARSEEGPQRVQVKALQVSEALALAREQERSQQTKVAFVGPQRVRTEAAYMLDVVEEGGGGVVEGALHGLKAMRVVHPSHVFGCSPPAQNLQEIRRQRAGS